MAEIPRSNILKRMGLVRGVICFVGVCGIVTACGKTDSPDAEVGGASSGSSGSGSAGEPPTAGVCSAKPVREGCEETLRWFNDSKGLCRRYLDSGCAPNGFETREACQAACPAPGIDDCEQPTDCQLGGVACCSACEADRVLEVDDFIAYKQGDGFTLGVYDGCRPSSCNCAEASPEQRVRQYFVPTCNVGQCGVLDIRTSDVTACDSADDCRLRLGTDCCEGCSDERLVAVRKGDAFDQLVCGDGGHACDDCAAQYPADARADCVAGRCVVSY